MIEPQTLAAAFALDLLAGDPRWLPHPVRLMGAAITLGERTLRRRTRSTRNEFYGGGLLSLLVIATSYISTRSMLARTKKRERTRLALMLEVALAWTTLAVRSLLTEARDVLDALETSDIHLARRRLAMIVGRDTQHLDENEIARAVIETVAESLCDGIFAPLFYLTLGGVPLAFAYKAVNTLDSMIGHRESPYLYFGRVAARTDDVANYLPARLSALALTGAALIAGADARSAWRVWQRDGDKHPSPNAGQPEAAMAGALNVRLGGVNYYDGAPHHKQHLGSEYAQATAKSARQCLRLALVAACIGGVAAVLICRMNEKQTLFDS